MLSQCTRACANSTSNPSGYALEIWLPVSHAPSCIGTKKTSRTGLKPLTLRTMANSHSQIRTIQINTLYINQCSFIVNFHSFSTRVYASKVALYCVRYILSYNNNKSREHLPSLPAVVTFCLLTMGWLNSGVTRQYESYFALKTTPRITRIRVLTRRSRNGIFVLIHPTSFIHIQNICWWARYRCNCQYALPELLLRLMHFSYKFAVCVTFLTSPVVFSVSTSFRHRELYKKNEMIYYTNVLFNPTKLSLLLLLSVKHQKRPLVFTWGFTYSIQFNGTFQN